MRCKQHLQDLTSTIGVCASCLRDRLQPLLEAQAQAQAQHARVCPRSSDHLQKPHHDDSIGLIFPRSVSPYVSCRKTDRDRRMDRSFYSTPMVGPAVSEGGKTTSSKKRLGKFWILSNLFQSGSNKSETSSGESRDPSSSAAASPSWLSTILHGRRQNRNRNWEESERGSSSEKKLGEEVDQCRWVDQTPKRSRLGSAGKTLSGMAICLSPLVRASPNRHWSQKGMMVAAQEGDGGTHNHTSYSSNRSRKFVDFGRVTTHTHNR